MTHRTKSLAQDLGQVVSKERVKQAWKNSIRNGLRSQLIPDLHDYLDIHRNIDGIASRISADVVSGHYRTSAPEFVTLEKKDGIARRLAIPDPTDALVLQCIVDTIQPQVGEAQPTKNAYYSRSHTPPSVDRVDGTFAYPWMHLWPEFQKRIWDFADTYQFVVVTDIANFFDTIPLSALRNTLASIAKINENVLNLLFFLLEALAWRPFFMPHSGVGLPQIDFDAPRLLATAYLFKVDSELNQQTNGSFVRWMDDIDAAVNSREEGKKLLQTLQEVLNSQGLQLNSNKSKILFAKEAIEHFGVSHNRALTIIQNSIENGADTPRTLVKHRENLRSSYLKFKQAKQFGSWEKVQKRYLTLFGKLKDSRAVRDLSKLLKDYPGTRDSVFRYLAELGFSDARFRLIEEFLKSGHCADVGSLFVGVKCLISLNLPSSENVVVRINALAAEIAKKQSENPAFPFGAALWLIAKYGSESELTKYIQDNHKIWERSAWASRQVAAVSPLVLQDARAYILEALQNNGLLQGLQVCTNLSRLRKMTSLDPQLNAYLYDTKAKDGALVFAKVILVVALLTGELSQSEKSRLVRHYLVTLFDNRYKLLIAKVSK